MFESLIAGIGAICHLSTIFVVLIGLVLGIMVGSVPGLTGMMAVALAIPLTFPMNAVDGLSLLMALYVGAVTGGLISAILLKMPGTPANIATTYDGYPMATDHHKPALALNIAIYSSFLGGLFSALCLFFIAPPLAELVLKLSPLDIFSIVLCAIILIGILSQGNYIKGVTAGLLGLFIGTIGFSPIDNVYRFTFGIHEIEGGLGFAPVLIGLFALSQIFVEISNINEIQPKVDLHFKNEFPSLDLLGKNKLNFLRSASIGEIIGIVPGIGAASAGILAWIAAKAGSKKPELFGKGNPEGVIAAETANNAVTGAGLIPLLTLGIPGCPVAAVLFGALMMKGIQPGPLVFDQNPDIIYGLFFSFLGANVGMFILMMFLIKPFAMVLKIPKYYMIPVIIVFCVVGTYAINNRYFDSLTAIVFGMIGYFMDKKGYPISPMALGFILGTIAERSLRVGLSASGGSVMPLLTSPVSLIFLIITVGIVVAIVIKARKKPGGQVLLENPAQEGAS